MVLLGLFGCLSVCQSIYVPLFLPLLLPFLFPLSHLPPFLISFLHSSIFFLWLPSFLLFISSFLLSFKISPQPKKDFWQGVEWMELQNVYLPKSSLPPFSISSWMILSASVLELG